MHSQTDPHSHQPGNAAASPSTHGVSQSQRGFLFTDSYFAGVPVLNTALDLCIRGPLDLGVLQRALDLLVERHGQLHTTFESAGADYIAICHAGCTQPLDQLSLEHIPEAEQASHLEALKGRLAAHKFDVRKLPLLAATLIRCSAETHHLVLVNHHATGDGESFFSLYINELAEAYAAFAEDRVPTLPVLSATFADFVQAESERLASPRFKRSLEHWIKSLEGAPSSLNLPTDHARPPLPSGRGARFVGPRFTGLFARLEAFATERAVTPLSVLTAAFLVLLNRYSQQEDMVIGIPFSNRASSAFSNVYGPQLNTLPLRSTLDTTTPFSSLLSQVQSNLFRSFMRSDVPFESIVAARGRHGDASRSEIHQVILNFLPFNILNSNWGSSLQVRVDRAFSGATFLDLVVELVPIHDDLEVAINYSTDLYDAPSVERMIAHLGQLLAGVMADPERAVGDYDMLSPAEHEQQAIWNNTERAFPVVNGLHELVFTQCKATPNATAIVDQHERLSYANLEQRAQCIQYALHKRGVQRGQIVGVCMNRGAHLIATILAILRAGAAYVPLDPAYPKDRVDFMLEDSRASLVVTDAEFASRFAGSPTSFLNYAEIELHTTPIATEASQVSGSDLAYVIYTSGSTGRPKGVAIEHHSPVAFVQWALTVFDPAELAGTLAGTSVCFDLSIFEMFVPLSCGCKVIVASNALELATLDARNEVTLLNTVPSAAMELLRVSGIPASVRTVNLAGEPLKAHLVDALYATGTIQKVYDLYGPSEDTTYSTYCLRQANAVETIGKPLLNTELFILAQGFQPQPVGVPGEIFLAGAGLARGYLFREELTSQVFLDVTVAGKSRRMYRTGDLARYLPDGNVQYIGRIGNQVKIRGFRVELGEIEASLRQCPGVAETLVLMREITPDDKRLVAYFVSHTDPAPTSADLRSALMAQLPGYMIPHHFVRLVEFPLTPNGKIDRKALPAPDQETGTEYQTPSLKRSRDATRMLWQLGWVPEAAARSTETPRRWLILADESGTADALAQRLNALGHVVTLVRSRDRFHQANPSEYALNPELGLSEYKQLVNALKLSGRLPDHVVSLWLASTSGPTRLGSSKYHRNLEHGLAAVTHLARSLSELSSARCVLTVVARSLHKSREQRAAGATLGACQSLSQELPGITLQYLELDSRIGVMKRLLDRPTAAADNLLPALLADVQQDNVRYRGGERVTPTWEPVHGGAPQLTLPKGCCVILGPEGPLARASVAVFGALSGVQVVRILDGGLNAAEDVAPASARPSVRGGAPKVVRTVEVNLGNRGELDNALVDVQGEYGAIRSAVLILDGHWEELPDEDLATQLSRRVIGYDALSAQNPELLIVHDRLACVLGLPGAVVGAAASAYIGDELSGAGRQLHVYWGPIHEEAGISPPSTSDSYVERDMRHFQAQGLNADELTTQLRIALNHSNTAGVIAVSPFDIHQLANVVRNSVRIDSGRATGRSFIAPRTTTEKLLARLWREALRLERVGIRDNFFDLGGHSLLAARLFSNISQEFKTVLPLSVLFRANTIEALAQELEATLAQGAEESGPTHQYLVKLHTGSMPGLRPLFVVGGAFGNVLNLRHLSGMCDLRRDFYGIQSRGLDGRELPHTSLKAAAADFLREVRAVQPKGPYLLGGFCIGGVTAVEMGRLLIAEGEQVEPIILLDSHIPEQRGQLSARDRMQTHVERVLKEGTDYVRGWATAKFRYESARLSERLGLVKRNNLTPADYASVAVHDAITQAMREYRAEFYEGCVLLYRPPLEVRHVLAGNRLVSSSRQFLLADNGWSARVGSLEVRELACPPGDHDGFVLEPYVRELADELRARLERLG